jgi:hypothetical protein
MICMDRRWHSMPDVVWQIKTLQKMEARRLLDMLAQCLAAVDTRVFTSPENLAPEGYSACMLEPGRAWV